MLYTLPHCMEPILASLVFRYWHRHLRLELRRLLLQLCVVLANSGGGLISVFVVVLGYVRERLGELDGIIQPLLFLLPVHMVTNGLNQLVLRHPLNIVNVISQIILLRQVLQFTCWVIVKSA